MDYSLLVGIEVLDNQSNNQMSVSDIHRIGAERRSEYGDQEEKVFIDIGEKMSKKHCFVSGNCVYHFAIIDYL